MKIGTLKFKDKWGFLELYHICSNYMDNQTEEGALKFLHRTEEFIDKYCEKKEVDV